MAAPGIVDPNRAIQRRTWIVERTGWVLLAAFLLWGLAGGTGTGMLASRHLASDTVSLSYDRFGRRGAATEMVLAWKKTPNDQIVVSLDSAFIDVMRVDFSSRGITPMRSGNRVVLRIPTAGAEGSLKFDAHPLRDGSHKSSLQVDGVDVGLILIFVFP